MFNPGNHIAILRYDEFMAVFAEDNDFELDAVQRSLKKRARGGLTKSAVHALLFERQCSVESATGEVALTYEKNVRVYMDWPVRICDSLLE